MNRIHKGICCSQTMLLSPSASTIVAMRFPNPIRTSTMIFDVDRIEERLKLHGDAWWIIQDFAKKNRPK